MADKKKKKYHRLWKRKEGMLKWNYNRHGQTFKSLLSSSTAVRERTWSSDKHLFACVVVLGVL